MKHIMAYSNDYVIFSGYVDINRLEEEKMCGRTYIHLWNKDEFIGVVACDRYEFC